MELDLMTEELPEDFTAEQLAERVKSKRCPGDAGIPGWDDGSIAMEQHYGPNWETMSMEEKLKIRIISFQKRIDYLESRTLTNFRVALSALRHELYRLGNDDDTMPGPIPEIYTVEPD